MLGTARFTSPFFLSPSTAGHVGSHSLSGLMNGKQWIPINALSHHSLLHLAVPKLWNLQCVSNSTHSSTAGIIKEYVPCSASGKKVDFCIYVDPSYSATSESSHQISTLRRTLPLHSINITDLEAVNKTPIAVSIETKRANAALDQAELQIGVWQAAQWNMLEALVTQRVARSATALGGQGAGGVEHKVAEALERLPFLPALIVHGHEWKLAATTREGKKTVRIPRALC